MFEEYIEELNKVSSGQWKLSLRSNKIYLLVVTCFVLPVCAVIFGMLVTTEKWWVGVILLSLGVIVCIVVVLVRRWMFKKYRQALMRENKKIDE